MRLAPLISVFAFLAAAASPSSGRVLIVDAGGSAPYTCIRDALFAAQTGDTVEVRPGEYRGDGNRDLSFFGKDIVLRSSGGAEATVIAPEGLPLEPHRAFSFSQPGTGGVLDGFTITGGYIGGGSGSLGGAVFVNGPAPEIRRCRFIDNWSQAGGAIHIVTSSLTLRDCELIGNESTRGGGLLAIHGAEVTITGTRFADNISRDACEPNGGAIACEDGSSMILRRCAIEQNVAEGVGAGIFITAASTATIDSCRIAGNVAYGMGGGGIWCSDYSPIQIWNTLIAGNSAGDGYGGGICCSGSAHPWLFGCTIAGNWIRAAYMDRGGGAIGVLGLTTPQLERCIVWGNFSTGHNGYDIFLSSDLSAVHLTCSDWNPEMSYIGPGRLYDHGGNIEDDPLLCELGEWWLHPVDDIDGRLAPDSPCFPETSPCGRLIGMSGDTCGVSGVVPPPGMALPPAAGKMEIAPNPACGPVQIRLFGPGTVEGAVRIFSADGTLVRRLALRGAPASGSAETVWDGRDEDGRRVPAGVYFARAGARLDPGRFILLR